MFVKQGEILPLLQTLPSCRSLQDCYNQPLTLQVYLSGDLKAEGFYYLDDGITFNAEGQLYNFFYEADKLNVIKVHGTNDEDRVVRTVEVYGHPAGSVTFDHLDFSLNDMEVGEIKQVAPKLK